MEVQAGQARNCLCKQEIMPCTALICQLRTSEASRQAFSHDPGSMVHQPQAGMIIFNKRNMKITHEQHARLLNGVDIAATCLKTSVNAAKQSAFKCTTRAVNVNQNPRLMQHTLYWSRELYAHDLSLLQPSQYLAGSLSGLSTKGDIVNFSD